MLNAITLFLCLAIFVRLFTYSRRGARYRPFVSMLAVLVMASTGAAAILIVAGHLQVSLHAMPVILLLAAFAVSVSRCKGNLSSVVRRMVSH